MSPVAEAATRPMKIPVSGGELLLEVPVGVSEQTLIKEIAGQDVVRKRLLDFIDRLERMSGTNRELMLCSRDRLDQITREFLFICGDLRRFVSDLSSYHSAIPELEDAREDVRMFFAGPVSDEIDSLERLKEEIFGDESAYLRKEELDPYRKKLAKSSGMVRTELQKVFAHLFTRDPRNLYRAAGPRSQQEILFRQFRRDVGLTESLYTAVRRLDTYMRGAIIPSDLLQMIADKIDSEESISCLFEQDYALFLEAMVDEVLKILLPELEETLHLDGIWYDDFENVERTSKRLREFGTSFKAFYVDRYGLRQALERRIGGEDAASAVLSEGTEGLALIRDVFDTFRYRQVSELIRDIDQVLVDLEGALLQWEKGIARRAFARDEWREAVPLQRKSRR